MPDSTRAKRLALKSAPREGRDWDPDQGIIDQLLHLRTFPDPASLMHDDVVVVWRNAIDAALDLVVPGLKSVLMLPKSSGNYFNAADIERIVGRVPLSRAERNQ